MQAVTIAERGAGELRRLWLLLGVLGALLAVRLVALGFNVTDLFFDEAQYWSWSLDPAFGYYSKPPLIAWVVRIATDSCGVSEFCIRLPAPLIHTASALVMFAIGRRLYDAATGFWSALVFATLPGISLSAGIISTDVPLLFFWALALLAFVWLIDTRAWWPALLLGAALGLGLNAKYAMAYFVLCGGIHLAATPDRRWLLRDKRLYLALAIGALLIAPNLVWNAANGFATFAHTADNARWTGALIHPGKALEFFGAQFGVFGPILFASLLVIAVRACRQELPAADRLLLAFAVPVIGIVTAQALLSRAHANWAAVAYVSAAVLVTATLLREASWGWLRASLVVHGVIVAMLAIGLAHAGSFRLPGIGDPFARTLGWRALAAETQGVLAEARRAGRPFGAVLTDDRSVTAELIYYMRGETTPVLAWRDQGRPRDHFELTRAFGGGSPQPVLLVSLRADPGAITRSFGRVERIAARDVAAGGSEHRRVAYFALSDLSRRQD